MFNQNNFSSLNELQYIKQKLCQTQFLGIKMKKMIVFGLNINITLYL